MRSRLPDKVSSESSRNDCIQPRCIDVDLVGGDAIFFDDGRFVVLLLHSDMVFNPLVAPRETGVAAICSPMARVRLR